MDYALNIHNLRKDFKGFSLKDISFSLPRGYIMGFIGPNGSGKTTTLKLIMNLMRADGGSIEVLGKDHLKHERDIKQRIGFVYDESVFYEQLSLSRMTGIIRPFYERWDEEKYAGYLRRFELDDGQKIKELSKGMRTKYALALALSHGAELLIMDEPTAGLDPIFRRELLDILLDVLQEEDKSILFSSHITSDLDRVADYITFIHQGSIVFSQDKDSLAERYKLVKGGLEQLSPELERRMLGLSRRDSGFEGLVEGEIAGEGLLVEKPSLEDLMYYHTKGGKHDR